MDLNFDRINLGSNTNDSRTTDEEICVRDFVLLHKPMFLIDVDINFGCGEVAQIIKNSKRLNKK